MLNKKMEEAINSQVNAELFSAYLYMSMNAWFQSKGLAGFANWMHVQAQEEMLHASKLYSFIHERGGRVRLTAIAAPTAEWPSPLAVFQAALSHEQKVTGLIDDLVNLAIQEKDHASNAFLQWFVTEQVEEESSAGQLVDKLKLIGDDTSGLFYLDRELALRVFTPPTQGGNGA